MSVDDIHAEWLRSQGITLHSPDPSADLITPEQRAAIDAEVERVRRDAKNAVDRLMNPAPLGAGDGEA